MCVCVCWWRGAGGLLHSFAYVCIWLQQGWFCLLRRIEAFPTAGSANGTQLYATSACLYNREWLRGQKHGSCADAFVRVHDDFGEVMRAVGVSGCLGSPRQRDDAGFKSYTRRRLTVLGLWSGMYLSLCAFTFTFPSFLLSGSRMPAWPPLALFLVPFPCGHCLPEGLGKTHGIVTHRRDSVK